MEKFRLPFLFVTSLLVISACHNNNNKSSHVGTSSSFESSITSNSEQSSLSSEISSLESQSSNNDNSSTSSSNAPSSSVSSSKPSSSSYTSSSSFKPAEVDSKWNLDLNLRGNAFRDALETLIKSKRTKTASYDDNKTIGPAAAAYGNSGKFVPFYHTTDTLTTYASCNREHTWPNSRGAGKSGPGSDPFIIRPTLTNENSSRGNNFYGIGSNEWDPASCGFEGSRGEAARVILYAATAYHTSHHFELSNNPSDATSANTMGTLKYLIQWNKTYPVTDMEIQINNYLSNNGYGRNPFVDHPEYADYIWNEQGVLNINSVTTDDCGNTTTTDAFENAMEVQSDIDAINNKEFSVVSAASATSTYYSLECETTTEATPWYLKGTQVNVKEDMSKMMPMSSDITLAKWKFQKQDSGKYTIYNVKNSKYLSTNVSGTHYNVGLTDSVSSDGSSYWTITTSGKGFKMVSDINIYLEYYKSSFCGYNNAPGVPIYLYA